jgi:hypothetical protein
MVFLTICNSIMVASQVSEDLPARAFIFPQVIWVYPVSHISHFHADNSVRKFFGCTQGNIFRICSCRSINFAAHHLSANRLKLPISQHVCFSDGFHYILLLHTGRFLRLRGPAGAGANFSPIGSGVPDEAYFAFS